MAFVKFKNNRSVMKPPTDDDSSVAAVRGFSRFYTRQIGLLHEGLLGGPLSLTEGRIIYELAQPGGEEHTAARLAAELSLDAGYLSRILRAFERGKLVKRRRSSADGRQSVLSLTPKGQAAFERIDTASHREVRALLDHLTSADKRRLVEALATVETLLSGKEKLAPKIPYLLRSPQPGDLGWIVHRQAVLYAQEYGWNEEFEALLAEIVAQFVRTFDSKRESCWVAEREDEVVGSIFLVRGSAREAKLRLLYVEPSARGLGIGGRLVTECVRFARQAGYRRLTLWTNDILTAARHLYERAGFQMAKEERHHSFGHELVGQHWKLDL